MITDFLTTVLTATFEGVGVPSSSIMYKQEKDPILLPQQRVEFEYTEEFYYVDQKKIKKQISEDTNYVEITKALYRAEFEMRIIVTSDDRDWLTRTVQAFLKDLALVGRDGEDNFIKMELFKAQRRRLEVPIAEVLPTFTTTLHLRAKHYITNKDSIPLIKDVNIKDNVSFERTNDDG